MLREGRVGDSAKTTDVPLNSACTPAEHEAMARGEAIKFQG